MFARTSIRFQLIGTVSITDPVEILHFLNTRFADVSPVGDFASMLVVCVNVPAQTLTYASAGHPAAWLLSASGELRELASTGLLLGIERDATWERTTFELAHADRLLMATDGVTETLNSRGEYFGQKRLTHYFRERRHLDLDTTIRQITEAAAGIHGRLGHRCLTRP